MMKTYLLALEMMYPGFEMFRTSLIPSHPQRVSVPIVLKYPRIEGSLVVHLIWYDKWEAMWDRIADHLRCTVVPTDIKVELHILHIGIFCPCPF